MRNLQSDMSLASLGVDALNKAFGSMSKTMSVAQINASGKTIKALMDFGSAGQDPAKAVEQVGVVVAALADRKKSLSDVITEAKKLGPEMEKALKGVKVKTKDEFKNLLTSGTLAEKGGVLGQFAAVNDTLISQLKAYFGVLRNEFADFGDQFLEPAKNAFQEVFFIIRRDLARASASIQQSLGFDTFTGGFVSAIDKVSNWMIKMLREYLPRAQGMFDRMGDWFFEFRRGWNLLLEKLRPLIDGAKVLYKAFDPIWEAIKRGADNLTLFRELLLKNQDDVQEFGQRIGDLIDSFSKFMMNLKKMFADMAPFINDLLAGIKSIFDILSKMLTFGAGQGLASALAPIFGFGILGKKMAGTKGMFMPQATAMNTQQMTVTANNVVVSGLVGPTGPASTAAALASGGSAAAVGGSPAAHGTSTAKTLASGGAANKVSGSPTASKLLASSPSGALHTPGQIGPSTSFGQAMQIGYNRPNAQPTYDRIEKYKAKYDARTAFLGPGLSSRTLASIAKYGDKAVSAAAGTTPYARALSMTPAERGGMSAETYAAGGVGSTVSYGQALKNSAARASAFARKAGMIGLDKTQLGIRRAAGMGSAAMSWARQPAWDPSLNEGKGGFVDLAKMRADSRNVMNQNIQERGGGRFVRGQEKFANFRRNLRFERNSTRVGAAAQRFSSSFGGRMGTSMGLGMLSQVAPEEMRGAMALGATVSQIDPMLGIGVAGLGGAMSARGGLKGGLSGAVGGAALGMKFGGAYGALAGAVIGGVFGVIKGTINKGKYEMEQAQQTARESIGRLYAGIATAAGTQFERNQKIVAAGGRVSGPGAFQRQAGLMGSARYRAASGILKMARTPKQADLYGKGGGQKTIEELFVETYKNQKDLGITISEAQYKQIMGKDSSGRDNRAYGFFKGLGLTGARDENTWWRDDYSNMNQMGQSQEFVDEINAYNRIQKQNDARIKQLGIISGKSGAELEILAKELGVNLYDPTVKFTDLVKKLGLAVIRTAEEMQQAVTDIFLAAGDIFRNRRESKEAAATINQSSRGLADQLNTGGLSGAERTSAVESYMETYFQQILAASGGDITTAYQATVASFGQEGKGAYAKGQVFEGLYGDINPAYQEGMGSIKKGIGKEYAGQLQAILQSKGLGVDLGQAERAIAGMSEDKLTTFMNLANRNQLFMGNEYTTEQAGEILKSLGLGGLALSQTPTEALDDMANAATEMSKNQAGLKTAIETFNKYTDDWFKKGFDDKPEWWSKEAMKEIMGSDTSTPRGDTTSSRLSQTMARHEAMNSQLTGKRSITSAYRTTALGSINSDHVMGRAYDLTGQNLGAYSRLVHENGGFAEFHGTLANRHLHVVPARGDTSSPMAPMGLSPMAKSSSGYGTTNYYNIEINGATQSPEAIANMVMAKIAEKERNGRERA
jgi:hypothetical protein